MSLDRKYRTLVVPDALTTDAITEVSDEYRRLVEMYGESTGRLTDLRQSKRDAESADRRAYASALTGAKDNPGTLGPTRRQRQSPTRSARSPRSKSQSGTPTRRWSRR